MAITATTLSAAAGSSDTTINVTSATGITAPNNQTGSGITLLLIDQEYLCVVSVSGTAIGVLRAQYGTQAKAHSTKATVSIGLNSDFQKNQEIYANTSTIRSTTNAFVRPALILSGTTDAIDPSIPGYYVIKTGAADACTLITPTAAMEGNIIEIFSDTAYAHTVTAATAVLEVGVAKTIATFPAAKGAGLCLRVTNLTYHVLYDGAHGTNAVVIVYT
jgi:hypothetical protein